MAKTRYNFTKEWTREYPILTQWVWYMTITHCLDEYTHQPNPYQPVIIDYVNHGLIEIYENQKALNWFKNQLLSLNKADKNFLTNILSKYQVINNKLEKICRNKKKLTRKGLIDYFNLWEEGVKLYAIFLYTSNDSRTPKEIKKTAVDFYDQDRYYIDSIPFIRKALKDVFPKLESLSNWILPHEFINNTIPPIKELKQREKNYILIPEITQEIISLPIFLKKHPEYTFTEPKAKNDRIMKGQIAYPGIVRGKVAIINKYSQIKNFRKGSIMVSPMTMPDYLPAMKIAAAFVTDEGGTTCHASITARELKKPCVVGTRVATKLLKDGDTIEVDANTGIVRKM